MSTLKTKLSVAQIQLSLYRHLFDSRNDIVVPNVSWGLLSYEADLLGISASGQVTEVEIKRSLSDLRADFKKRHHHDDEIVTYFYYCIPESLLEKAKAAILENEKKAHPYADIKESDCPAILVYTEDAQIKETGFGKAKRYGYHRISDHEKETLGRLGTLRYWDVLEKTLHPEDFGDKAKIRKLQDELRTVKKIMAVNEEDYRMLTRLLRYKYPGIYAEYLDIGAEMTPEARQQSTMDAIQSRKMKFIESIITKYGLKGKEGTEIRTRAVCTDNCSNPHPGDNLITEVLYKDHLIAMVYERRDDYNWTETNCIDLNPKL